MKLRGLSESERRKRRLKAAEVVGRQEQAEHGLEFDASKVVGRKIWARLDEILTTGVIERYSQELPFVRLVAFDSGRRRRAEQNDEFPREIQRAIFEIARHDTDPDVAVNAELARYIDLFPQVMDGLDNPLAPTPHDLGKSLTFFDREKWIDHDIERLAPKMRALVQLFPEQKDLIFQKIEQVQFWEQALKGAQHISRPPVGALNHLPAILANLAVIFPDRTEDLLKIIRPHWNQLQDRLAAWGNQLDMELDDPGSDEWLMKRPVTAYVDNIMGMAFLAELSQKKSLRTTPQLPERLTA